MATQFARPTSALLTISADRAVAACRARRSTSRLYTHTIVVHESRAANNNACSDTAFTAALADCSDDLVPSRSAPGTMSSNLLSLQVTIYVHSRRRSKASLASTNDDCLLQISPGDRLPLWDCRLLDKLRLSRCCDSFAHASHRERPVIFHIVYRQIRLPLLLSIGLTAIAVLNRFGTYLFMQDSALTGGLGVALFLLILSCLALS